MRLAASAAMDHFSHLHALLKELEPEGIALWEHKYAQETFGSFAVVLGAHHKRARFTWNGQESILTVEYAAVTAQGATSPWQHDAYISVSSREDVFAEIGSNAISMLT